MREIVFTPLGMTSCGFGGLGTPGTIDQPWPHTANGQPTPLRDMAVLAVTNQAGDAAAQAVDEAVAAMIRLQEKR